MKKYTLILLIALFSLSFSLHKHYVSLCEVEYIQKKKSLQIITSVFTDDLQNAIAKENNTDFQIDENSDSLCLLYLQKHLKFEVNGKSKKYTYIGKEFINDKVFFYLEITDIPQLYTIKVNNTLLLSYFNTQKNIVKIKIGNRYKSFYLNNTNPIALFKF